MNTSLPAIDRLVELLEALIAAVRGRIDEVFQDVAALIAALNKLAESPSVIATKVDHSVSTICWTVGSCAAALLVGLIYHAHVSRNT